LLDSLLQEKNSYFCGEIVDPHHGGAELHGVSEQLQW